MPIWRLMNREHILAQILLRSWPFPYGAGRLTDKFFGKLQFSELTARIRTSDRFEMTILPNDLIGRHLYLTGEFDRSIVKILCDFARPGDTLLDIGANVGYVSACFLAKIPNSRAVSVEPQPHLVDILRQNLLQFGGLVYPYAISDRDGEAFFATDPANSGEGHLSDEGTKIEIRSADSLFRDTNLTKLDLVKIDVEGHEEQVISSCLSHFERLKPRAILFEDSARKAPVIRRMLSSYKSYGIRKTLTRLELKPIISDQHCSYHDYVAVRRS
jgi:FkbM family methyltransferase